MYTIQLLNSSSIKLNRIMEALKVKLSKDGRFTCDLVEGLVKSGKRGQNDLAIFVKRVRLTKAKSYCGNHPGECPVTNERKPISKYLEWNDWVAFHALVNTTLNKFHTNANVWSLPQDVKGKMWIRKGKFARKRFDWDETYSYGRLVRIWNAGTDDQF
jgi:hypothetical protein